MGFHEDDRIRQKNKAHNEACEMLAAMRFAKLTDSDIRVACLAAMISDSRRNEIYSTVLRIVGGSREQTD